MNQLEKEKRNIQNKDIKNKNKEINGKSHFDGKMLRNIAIICVITIFLFAIGLFSNRFIEKTPSSGNTSSAADSKLKVVSSEVISEELKTIGELATVQDVYSGSVTVEDGKIPFITKKGYTMYYTASIKAGLDLSNASSDSVNITDNVITIKIPKAKILDINVDASSCVFLNESKALFNWDSSKDGVKTVEYAKSEAQKNFNQTELLKRAENNAVDLIKKILGPLVDGKSVEVVVQ